MNRMYRLPQTTSIEQVSEWVRYPVIAAQVVAMGKEKGASASLIKFISLFSPDDVFYSKADFMDSCDELKFLIREKRMMPHEVVYV